MEFTARINSSDAWDDVVFVEQNAFENGHRQAAHDAMQGTSFGDGFTTGLAKGLSIMSEIYFINKIATLHMQKIDASSSSSSSSSVSERYKKRLGILIALTTKFPKTIEAAMDSSSNSNNSNTPNEDDFDYTAKLEEARALFRSLNIGIASMLPTATSNTNISSSGLESDRIGSVFLGAGNQSW